MKFTALEEYGLRCILHLARMELKRKERNPGNAGSSESRESASLTLGEIADNEGLTQQYAGKIFRILAKAGLVESERGRKGGYHLTRRPDAIRLSEVLGALGGKFFERSLCRRYTGDRASCVHTTNCAIRSVWMEVQRAVDQVLESNTLQDLVFRENTIDEALRSVPQELALTSLEDLGETASPRRNP
jgi:Rrf2 family protein